MASLNFKLENNINFNKIRIESCIGTILSIKNKIKNKKNIDPVFMFQFNRLESIIPQLKVDTIQDNEVEKIENATNNLFHQMRSLFNDDDDIKAYDGLRH